MQSITLTDPGFEPKRLLITVKFESAEWKNPRRPMLFETVEGADLRPRLHALDADWEPTSPS